MQNRQKSEPLIPKSIFSVSPVRAVFEMRQVVWLFSYENWVEKFKLFT